MIAKVFPIRRLPAHAGPYDYIAPSNIQVGDLVEITFKRQLMLGIVWALEDRSDLIKIETIGKVLEKEFLQSEDRLRFDSLALITAQSVSSYLALLPIAKSGGSKKQSIRKSARTWTYTQEEVVSAKKQAKELTIIDTLHNWPLHILFRLQEPKQYVIICPNEETSSFLHAIISKKEKAEFVYGGMKFEEERRVFNGWRTGSCRVLVTTRNAVLWPAHDLAGVIIIDESNPDYDFRPRNPRYDARLAAHLLAAQAHVPLYRIGHGTTLEQATCTQAMEKPEIIDASKHPSKAPYFSLPVVQAMKETIEEGRGIVLFLNKKGVATHFQCRACGHLPTCGNCGAIPIVRINDLVCPACHTEMWHPEKCPTCHKKTVTKKGIGIEFVEKSVAELFPEAKNIYTVSEFGMRDIDKIPLKNIGLIIDLCADYHLLDDSYACEERGLYKLMRFIHIAKDHKARAIIQTYQPSRIHTLLSPEWAEKELKLRKKHKLPPYSIEIIIQPKDGRKETLRPVDKELLLQYLMTFRSLGRKDTIEIQPQIAAYERITPPQ